MNGVMETKVDNDNANIPNEKPNDKNIEIEDKSNNKLNNNADKDELTTEKQTMASDMSQPHSPSSAKKIKLSSQYVCEEKDDSNTKTGHNSTPEIPEKTSTDEGLAAPSQENEEKKSQLVSPSLPQHNSSATTATYLEPQFALISTAASATLSIKADTALSPRCHGVVSTNSCSSSPKKDVDRKIQNKMEEETVGIVNLVSAENSTNLSKTLDGSVKYIKKDIPADKRNKIQLNEQEEKTQQKIKEEKHLIVTNSSQKVKEFEQEELLTEKSDQVEVKEVSATVITSSELSSKSRVLSTSDLTPATTSQGETLTISMTTTASTITTSTTTAVTSSIEEQQLLATTLPPPLQNTSDPEKMSETNVNKSSTLYRKRKSGGKSAKQETGSDEYISLKRRKINVAGAPKMPLTGYVRYMNDRREELRRDYPDRTSMEHTKMIGEEWQALSPERRAPYMKAAELDKIRYNDELNAFLKSRPDVLASELARNKQTTRKSSDNQQQTPIQSKEKLNGNNREKANRSSNARSPTFSSAQHNIQGEKLSKGKRTPTPPKQNHANNRTNGCCPPPDGSAGTVSSNIAGVGGFCSSSSSSSSSTNSLSGSSGSNTAAMLGAMMASSNSGEIPIFTHEFLDHNRTYDLELKALRKSKTDLEQQNAILEKYVENMKCGVDKLISENDELQQKNHHLQLYLDKLKRKLAQALSALPLPSAPNGATVDNIDIYMQELYRMSTANTHGPATLNKAKDIIRKLDLHIQL